MSNFKDNFSDHASEYARHRPTYPVGLFEFLNTLVPCRETAWDAGTGNGQCAIQLSDHFNQVYASDPSTEQISRAYIKDNIRYVVEKAEEPDLPENSIGLVTVAQALHWFDHERFFSAVKRVLKPGGIICVISYINPVVSDEIDLLTDKLHDEILDGYWQPENKIVQNKYASIPFPFKEINTPYFSIVRDLSLDEFKGHLSSWSAVQRFINQNNSSPLNLIAEDLQELWGADRVKRVRWELALKTGKVLK